MTVHWRCYAAGMAPDDEKGTAHVVVRYYIPIGHHLGVPDGWVVHLYPPLDTRTQMQIALGREAHPPPVVLRVHQCELVIDALLADQDVAFELARRILGSEAAEDASAERSRPPRTTLRTVVEIQLDLDDGDAASVAGGLDVAVHFAQLVQRASAVTLQRAVPLVSRRQLPPMLPVLVSKSDGTTDTGTRHSFR